MTSTVLADGVVTVVNPGAAWRDQGFSGGAFQIDVNTPYVGETGGPGPGNPASSFLSFCLEHNENIGFGGVYNAYINTSAYLGGVGGGGAPNGDPIDSRTAALYAEFRGANAFGGTNAVTLTTFGGAGVDTAVETRALQQAIWYIEQEITSLPSTLATDFYNWAVSHDSGDIGLVRVLRLYNRNSDGSDGALAQDQLTIVPLPPAAWAGMGSLAGVMAIGFVRRRRHVS
jgi:hypothetical protein